MIIDGARRLMVVTPAKYLFNSTMIHDVITRGRKFVVDIDTGLLEIYPLTTKKRFTFRLPGRPEVELATKLDVALVQIRDYILDWGWQSGRYTLKYYGKYMTYLDSDPKQQNYGQFMEYAREFISKKRS